MDVIEKGYFSRFKNILSEAQALSANNYVKGVTTEIRSFSVAGFTDYLGTRYDAIDYFISRSKWDERKLNRERLLYDLRSAQNQTFDFVVDESGMLKHTMRPYFVARQWIGNIGKVDKCFSNVFGNFINDSDNIPFDLSHYLHSGKLLGGSKDFEFKSKQELFMALCMRAFFMAMQVGIPLRYFIFDSWFASSGNLNTFNRGNVLYLTEVRPNRLVEAGNSWVNAKDLVTVLRLIPTEVTHQNKLFSVSSYTGHLKLVDHPVKIFVVRGRFKHGLETRIFVSNDLSITDQNILTLIGRRWHIEYFFRESKANLALDQGKFQKLVCYRRHFYLCMLAWSISRKHIKLKTFLGIKTIFAYVRFKTKLHLTSTT